MGSLLRHLHITAVFVVQDDIPSTDLKILENVYCAHQDGVKKAVKVKAASNVKLVGTSPTRENQPAFPVCLGNLGNKKDLFPAQNVLLAHLLNFQDKSLASYAQLVAHL